MRASKSLPAATLPLVLLLGAASPAWAADGLGTPITSDVTALWPIAVELELVSLDPGDEATAAPIRHRVSTRDGEEITLARSLPSASGELSFEIAVVPRAHPGGSIEVEWTVQVTEAEYERLGLASYFLHRLRLGPGPGIGPGTLRLSRADIVTMRDHDLHEVLQLGDRRYAFRIFARTTRG